MKSSLLQEQLRQDLKVAMKEKKSSLVSILRMVLSSLRNLSIDQKGELSDADIVRVIQKEIKQKEETIEHLVHADNTDAVILEREQIEFLGQYLPETLSEEEVLRRINAVIETMDTPSMKDIGLVMKEVMPSLEGTFDGRRAQEMVREALQSL